MRPTAPAATAARSRVPIPREIGILIGAAFVVLLPRVLEDLAPRLPFIASGGQDGLLSVFQLQTILFGAMIILFLTLEPRGLFGLWHRVRTYFTTWPFRY